MTYLEYLARIKQANPNPNKDDAEYWNALHHKAEQVQSTLRDEAQEAKDRERNERVKEYLADYQKTRVCKSNVDFAAWEKEYDKSIRIMSEIDPRTVSASDKSRCYESDVAANIAAMEYVNRVAPEEPDPERVAMLKKANEIMYELDLADEIHRHRRVLVKVNDYECVGCVNEL